MWQGSKTKENEEKKKDFIYCFGLTCSKKAMTSLMLSWSMVEKSPGYFSEHKTTKGPLYFSL